MDNELVLRIYKIIKNQSKTDDKDFYKNLCLENIELVKLNKSLKSNLDNHKDALLKLSNRYKDKQHTNYVLNDAYNELEKENIVLKNRVEFLQDDMNDVIKKRINTLKVMLVKMVNANELLKDENFKYNLNVVNLKNELKNELDNEFEQEKLLLKTEIQNTNIKITEIQLVNKKLELELEQMKEKYIKKELQITTLQDEILKHNKFLHDEKYNNNLIKEQQLTITTLKTQLEDNILINSKLLKEKEQLLTNYEILKLKNDEQNERDKNENILEISNILMSEQEQNEQEQNEQEQNEQEQNEQNEQEKQEEQNEQEQDDYIINEIDNISDDKNIMETINNLCNTDKLFNIKRRNTKNTKKTKEFFDNVLMQAKFPLKNIHLALKKEDNDIKNNCIFIKHHTYNKDIIKPDVKQNINPDVKQNINPDVKQNINPDVKQYINPDVKQDINPDVKQDVNLYIKQIGGKRKIINKKVIEVDDLLKMYIGDNITTLTEQELNKDDINNNKNLLNRIYNRKYQREYYKLAKNK